MNENRIKVNQAVDLHGQRQIFPLVDFKVVEFPPGNVARVIGLVQNHHDVHEGHAGETDQPHVVEVIENFLELPVVANQVHDFVKRDVFLVRHYQSVGSVLFDKQESWQARDDLFEFYLIVKCDVG